MPQTVSQVRGNLGANPKFFPANDAEHRQAYWTANVYTNRRVKGADGNYQDDPRGPEKNTVKFWGRTAETLNRLDLRQGDPVVATGYQGEPEAYISQQDNKPYAHNVLNGVTLCVDSVRVEQRKEREASRDAVATHDEGLQASAGYGADWAGDGFAAGIDNDPYAAAQSGPVR
ncbi:MAG: hypothetical protein LKI21_07585 [Bifidobacterium crudilactis]|nr:hypothetical protein [Bifidobacterium crudilactis]